MSTQQKEEEGCTEDVTLNKAESTDEKKKKVVKRKKRRKRRRSSSSEAARDELDMCRTFQQRYGTKKKVQDEPKEALFNPNNGQIFHPSSYERMMTRSIEAHLNRLLQPEPPDDLVNSNWLCALCLKPAFADEQGDLYGPYFVRLSSDCQPPAELLMKHQSVRSEPEANGSLITVHRVNSKGVPKAGANSNKLEVERRASPSKRSPKTFPIQGSLDIWLHGDCALWAPELFMVGGRFPTLQLHIQRYWKQKCFVCSGVGATVPITYSQATATPSNGAMKGGKTENSSIESHFLHYKCALENGYRFNSLTYVCRPPIIKAQV